MGFVSFVRRVLRLRLPYPPTKTSMPPDMLIRDAMDIAREAKKEILKSASNISQVRIQLRLGHLMPQLHSGNNNEEKEGFHHSQAFNPGSIPLTSAANLSVHGAANLRPPLQALYVPTFLRGRSGNTFSYSSIWAVMGAVQMVHKESAGSIHYT